MAKDAIVRINNQSGALARVTKSVADKGINIEAVIATVEGAEAVIHLVTSDHQRTINILREQQLEVQETKVVVVEALHRPGLLQHITEKLARENMNLSYLYATAADADRCLVVFSCTNNDWAVMVLNS
ncbi:MAG: hypothetical protein ABSF60_11780 [Verrucomicrobiota bacterium]|jgi:hypothetical protein